MKARIWVEFIISGFDIPHKELTKQLGIKPTEAENKGDLIKSQSGKLINLKVSSWTLESGFSSDVGLTTQLEGLLNKIRPYKNNFKKICSLFPPNINIIIHLYSDFGPLLDWENTVIKEVAEYNASMGIDLTIWREENAKV